MADYKGLVEKYQGYGADDSGSHVVYDSRSASSYVPGKDNGTSEAAEMAAGILNDIRRNRAAVEAQNSQNTAQGMMDGSMHIYRGASPATGFNTYAQSAAEGLKHLHNMRDGDSAVLYDTEILGTLPHNRKKNSVDFYEPTEFAFQSFKMSKGQLKAQEDKALSLLLQPSASGARRLEAMIDKLDSSLWTGLTDDERRTLADLTLYSGNTDKIFTTVDRNGRSITTVDQQTRTNHPLADSVLKSKENIKNMREGLAALKQFGTHPTDAITVIEEMMSSAGNPVIGGYNTLSFDQPLMVDYVDRIRKGEFDFTDKSTNKKISAYQASKGVVDNFDKRMKKPQVDGLHIVKTFEKTPFSKFGKSLKLDQKKEMLGMTGVGQAHHGLSDVNVTAAQFNMLLSDEYRNIAKNSSIDEQPLSIGDKLFAHTAITSRNAGKFDGVYRQTETGALKSAYDMSPNPIYSNATYEVKNLFSNVDIDGKKRFGIELFNTRDELTHTLIRDSEKELQAAIHGSLEYITEEKPGHRRAGEIQNEDRAMRRINRMFSTETSGGVGMARRALEALEYIKENEGKMEEKDLIAGVIQLDTRRNTPEFYRDLKTSRSRLEGERQWIEGFLKNLDESGLAGSNPENIRAQNMAFAEFGKLTDAAFGENRADREIPAHSKALPLDIDGETSYINLTHPERVKNSLRSKINQGNPGYQAKKHRFNEMLLQLKTLNALDAKQFEQYAKGLKTYKSGESFDTMLTEISNALIKARDQNSMSGALSFIPVEDPTKVHRSVDMTKLDEISQKAIGGVQPFLAKRSEKLVLSGKAGEMMEAHDEAINTMLSRNGIKNMRHADGTESLTRAVRAYEDLGLNVQLRYNGKLKGMQMVLATQQVSEAVLNGDMDGILKNNNTAVIDIPHLNSDGTISRGSQSKVAHSILRKDKSGYRVETGFDVAMSALTRNAKYVGETLENADVLGKSNPMNGVHSRLNRTMRSTLQNLSSNNKFINPNNQDDTFNPTSKAANWTKAGYFDIEAIAEEWYGDWYKTLSPEMKMKRGIDPIDKVKARAERNKEKFSQSMGMIPTQIFHRESDEYVSARLGVEVGQASVRDTHASNFLRSTRDIRELTPGGYMNPMARENILKSINYQSLETEEVRRTLMRQVDPETGERIFSNSEIERMTTRRYITDTAQEVLEEFTTPDKLSYLNMNVAYMSDAQIAKRAESLTAEYQEKISNAKSSVERKKYEGLLNELQSIEAMSTYDGMMMMSKETSQVFDRNRQKVIKISEGAELTDEIQDKFKSVYGEFDPTQSYSFEKGVPLGTKGAQKITISNLVQQDVLAAAEGQREERIKDKEFSKWYNDDMTITGWDADNQALILNQRVKAMQGTKIVSDAGDRLTITQRSRQLMSDLTGIEGVDGILPQHSTSKGMVGTMLDSQVARAVNTAMDSISVKEKTYTVGDLQKLDSMEVLREMFVKHFGIDEKDAVKVVRRDGNSMLSVSADMMKNAENYNFKNLHGFLEESGNVFGIDLLRKDSDILSGSLGVAAANIYDWEDTSGDTGDLAGKVRYGRKEADMVITRADQVLNQDSSMRKRIEKTGTNPVGQWMQDHFERVLYDQSPEAVRISRGVLQSAAYGASAKPGEGDVVIKTRGMAFPGEDPRGIGLGRVTPDGVREISMHNVVDSPSSQSKLTQPITQDYARTIIDFGRIEGQFDDGTSFTEAFKNSGGTAYMEMPDDTFSRNYIRMVDFGDVTRDGKASRVEMQEVQKIEKSIWDDIREYQDASGVGGEVSNEHVAGLRDRIENNMDKHRDALAKMATSGRDGSVSRMMNSVGMDMSGRFKSQGVNPLANYEAGEDGIFNQKKNAAYKEGTAYISRNALGEMIAGQESKIAEEFFGLDKVTMGKMTTAEIKQHVIDGVDQGTGKGLYGIVNRFPTIKQTTVQALEFKIDPFAAEDDRTMRFAPGTAAAMNADNDGDALNAILTMYKSENAEEIHDAMKLVVEQNRADNAAVGSGIVTEYADELNSTSKYMNYTMQDLLKASQDASLKNPEDRSSAENMAYDIWNNVKARTTARDAIETIEARQGKNIVGIIDNTRDKMLSLASATVELLEGEGRMDKDVAYRYRNIIEDKTAAFSQDLISSKKFDVRTEVKRLMETEGLDSETANERAAVSVRNRHMKVDEMNQALLNMTDENRKIFESHNAEIGLFSVADKESIKQFDETLDMIQNVQRWTSRSGGARNKSLANALSDGKSADAAQDFLNAAEGPVIPISQNRAISKVMSGTEIGDNLDKSMDVFNRLTLQTFDDMTNSSRAVQDTLDGAARMTMSGNTMAEDGAIRLRDMAQKFTPDVGVSGRGMAGGAIGFGAMWAASAIIRGGPTPEGLQEQTQQAGPPPPNKANLSMPTARVTENKGEHLNIRIDASEVGGMNQEEVANLVQTEVQSLMNTQLSTTMNINDNTQNIDPAWLQGVVANAIDKGLAF